MLLINGIRSGKSTWKRGLVGSSCCVMAGNFTIPVVLCEDDIPGASLAGRQPLHCVKCRNVITMAYQASFPSILAHATPSGRHLWVACISRRIVQTNAVFIQDTFTWGKLTFLLYCVTFSNCEMTFTSCKCVSYKHGIRLSSCFIKTEY